MTGIGEEMATLRLVPYEGGAPGPPEFEGLFVDFVERIQRRQVLVIRCSDGLVLDTRPVDGRKAKGRQGDRARGRRERC
jgi:hypothetical protein